MITLLILGILAISIIVILGLAITIGGGTILILFGDLFIAIYVIYRLIKLKKKETY